MSTKPFNGIIPPMITPLTDDWKLDVAGVENMVEHLLAGGVNGIFILGTTGEGPGISYKIRKELIKKSCEQVNGRVPVLVGITDTSFDEKMDIAACCADNGVAAVVSAPPYYFAPNQDELISFYTKVANELPIPLFMYNMPNQTKVNLEVSTLKKLSEHKNIIGIKDSSCSMLYFQNLLYAFRDRPDYPILIGPEEMMTLAVLQGGAGGVSGGANLFPKLYVDAYHAAVNRDFAKISELQNKIMDVVSAIYRNGNYGSSLIMGVKSALNIMGLCNDQMALPFNKMPKNHREIIKERLIALDLGAKIVNP